MFAWLGVAARTGPIQNQAGDEPKSSQNKRSGAGKEAAKKKSASMESSGVTGGGGGTTDGGGTTEATGATGVTGATGGTEAETLAVPQAPVAQPKVAKAGAKEAPLPEKRWKIVTDEELFGGDFGDDMSKWVVDEGPYRIKTSQLTDEEKAKFKRHVDLIFSREIVLDKRVNFDMDDVMEVMKKVIPYLESEPVLIEDVPFGISIVGDIHGQLYDLDRVFCGDDKDGKPGWERGKKYLFLGDYVDRGRQCLEVVMALFCLKMLYPDDIFLLRGNHEYMKTNMHDPNEVSFCDEINERYEPEDARIIYFQVNETFWYLSIAAIVGDSYFCAHGGISPGFATRDQLRGIYKPIIRSTDEVIVHDMMWSDPAKGIVGSTYNAGRGTSCVYGFDVLVIAMACLGVKAVFRGHQVKREGYECYWDVLYSLFTSTSEKVKGAVAVLDANGKLSMRVLIIDPRRLALEQQFRQERGLPTAENNDKTRYGPAKKT